MTDNQPDLRHALQGALPDPPNLAGLALRAEADGRRRRAQRRAVVGVGAVAAVTAVTASFAFASGTSPDAAQDNPSPSPVRAVACDSTLDARTGDLVRRDPVAADAAPVSVRFCPAVRNQPGGQRVSAVVPDAALITDVPATVEALSDTLRPFSGCTTERNLYRIQIAYDDGAVRDIRDSVCDEAFPVLLEAIGRQQAEGLPEVGARASCADQTVRARPGDFSVNKPLKSLTQAPAVEAVRCEGTIGNQIETTVSDPESLRAALLSDVTPGIADCERRPALPTVTWVLAMADGTRHIVTFDRRSCGALMIDDEGFGVGGGLLRDLAR